MKLESRHDVLLDRIEPAFEYAVDDTIAEARREVRSRTGKFARSLRRGATERIGEHLWTRIGSPLASARVKEKGGYMTAKRARWLAIPQQDGSIRQVKAVRIRATPILSKAGPTFPRHFLASLRAKRP